MLVQGFIYRRLVQRVGEVRFMRLGRLDGVGLLGGVGSSWRWSSRAPARG